MRRADAQPVLDVREIAPAGEEAEEVLPLRPLHASDRRLVPEELPRVRVLEEQPVELLDDFVHHLLGEGPQGREALQIVVGEGEEGPPVRDLLLVQLENAHVFPVVIHRDSPRRPLRSRENCLYHGVRGPWTATSSSTH